MVGILWAYMAWSFFPSLPDGAMTVSFSAGYLLEHFVLFPLTWLLVALAFLDFEHLWLPDFLTLPGVALGFLFETLRQTVGSQFRERFWPAAWINLRAILIAAGLILVIRLVYWLFRRQEGIGLGDAKLMALLAAWLGLPGALLSFFFGVILGALVAVPLLLTRRAATAKLPLGTFLCTGGIVTALWGRQIIDTYLTWAGF